MRYEPQAGTVISGTLRSDDLLRAFAAELGRLGAPVDWPTPIDQMSEDEKQEWVVALMDELDCYAPPSHYFGAHEGDGSDFGYWPDEREEWLDPVKPAVYYLWAEWSGEMVTSETPMMGFGWLRVRSPVHGVYQFVSERGQVLALSCKAGSGQEAHELFMQHPEYAAFYEEEWGDDPLGAWHGRNE